MRESGKTHTRIISEVKAETGTSHMCTPVTLNAIAAQSFPHHEDKPRQRY